MIVFDLVCRPQGHVFEAWFGSSHDYEDQRQRGLVQCPLCSAPDVEKAVMAPNVGPKGNRGAVASVDKSGATPNPEAVKALLAAMATAQREMLEGSDFVGDSFAAEARAIHLGESDARAIHGRATPEQTRSLIEDGIKVAPLPFPVLEPEQKN